MGSDYVTIKASALKGIVWFGGGRVATQILQFVTSIVLARLLTPGDFGLIGMTIAVVGFGELFADFGIGAAIVPAKTLTRAAISSAFWFSAAVAGVVALALGALAPLISSYYGDPRVAEVLPILSFNMLLVACTSVPVALLQRSLAFHRTAVVQVCGALAGAATAIGLAVAGAGYWSLVAQPMIAAVVMLTIALYCARWLPGPVFIWREVRELVHFGTNVFGINVLNYASRNVDKVIIGRILGSTALGYYAMAYRLMLYPLTEVSSVFVRVLFPSLSRIDDRSEFCNFYLKAIGAIAFVTFPMMLGLFIVAPDFVAVLFGEQWVPMTAILQVFCATGLVQSIMTTVGVIFLSTGNSRVALRITLYATPVYIASFVIGTHWGALGVASCYTIATVSIAAIVFPRAAAIAGFSLRDAFNALYRPATAAVAMAALLAALSSLPWSATLSPLVRLAASVSLGALLYISIWRMVFPTTLADMVAVARRAARR